MYYIGIDGGGTKTRGLLGTKEGRILSDVTLGPSNHQLTGINKTFDVLSEMIMLLLLRASVNREDLSYLYLGLSGADLESDFQQLNDCVKRIVPDIPFLVENDTWPILRSGLKKPYGVVSIYGTGANAAVIDLDGKKFILKSLGYPLGGFGGGHEIALEALQFAFRAEEGTYKPSRLTKELPELMNVDNMDALLEKLYPENRIPHEQYTKIPPLVFKLAECGDEVCIEILEQFGKVQGQMVSSVIKKANLESPIPIVLGGSIHEVKDNHFSKAFMLELSKLQSSFDIIHPSYPPVAGAFLMALDQAGTVDNHVYANLENYFNEC